MEKNEKDHRTSGMYDVMMFAILTLFIAFIVYTCNNHEKPVTESPKTEVCK